MERRKRSPPGARYSSKSLCWWVSSRTLGGLRWCIEIFFSISQLIFSAPDPRGSHGSSSSCHFDIHCPRGPSGAPVGGGARWTLLCHLRRVRTHLCLIFSLCTLRKKNKCTVLNSSLIRSFFFMIYYNLTKEHFRQGSHRRDMLYTAHTGSLYLIVGEAIKPVYTGVIMRRIAWLTLYLQNFFFFVVFRDIA